MDASDNNTLDSGSGDPGKNEAKDSTKDPVELNVPKQASKFQASVVFLSKVLASNTIPSGVKTMIELAELNDFKQDGYRKSIVDMMTKAGVTQEEWSIVNNMSEATIRRQLDKTGKKSFDEKKSSPISGIISQDAKLKIQNKMIDTITKSLGLKKIPEPTTSEEDEEFITKLGEARQEISDYCDRFKFPQSVGVEYLGNLLQGSPSFDYQSIIKSIKFKAVENTQGAINYVYHTLAATRGVKKITDLEEELNDARSVKYPSLSAIWSKYTTIIKKFPKQLEARRMNEELMLKEIKSLMKQHVHWKSLKLHLDNMKITSGTDINDLHQYRCIIKNIEKNVLDVENDLTVKIKTTNVRHQGRPESDYKDTSQIPCRFWKRNKSCRNGSKCRYLHVQDGSNGQNHDHNSGRNQGETKRIEPICVQYWKNGKCGGCPGLKHVSHKEILLQKKTKFCPVCSKPKRMKFHLYCVTCFKFQKSTKGTTSGINNDNIGIDDDNLSQGSVDSKTGSVANSTTGAHHFPDRRYWLKSRQFKEKTLMLADLGAQVSMMGVAEAETFLKLGHNTKTQRARIAITGALPGKGLSTKYVKGSIDLFLADGSTMQFHVNALVCSSVRGVTIGEPDLRLNGIRIDCKARTFTIKGNEVWHKTSNRTKTKPIEMKMMNVEIKAVEPVEAKPKPVKTVANPYADLVRNSTGHPPPEYLEEWNRREKEEMISTENRLLKEVRPFPEDGGDPKVLFYNNEIMLKRVNELQKDVESGDCVLSQSMFYKVRYALSLFQDRFVTQLEKVGQMKCKPYTLKGSLTYEGDLKARPIRLDPVREEHLERALMKDVENGHRFIPEANQVIITNPTFGVYEKDKLRVVGDLRALNKLTKLDQYPTPTTQNSLEKAARARFRSIFDLKLGFNQIPKDLYTLMRTIYATIKRLYASWGLDFGLKNAPQYFMAVMQDIFKDVKNFLAHIDDCLTYGSSEEEWFTSFVHTLKVSRLREAYWKLSKLQICMRKMKFLGHVFHNDHIEPDKSRIKALENIAAPTTKRLAQGVVGLFVYWRAYIPMFSKITSPIRKVITEAIGQKIVWTEEAQAGLEKLKTAILKNAVLWFPDYKKVTEENPFMLYTDSSGVAMGYVLVHEKKLVKCGSKTFKTHELKWPITRKEFHGLVWAIEDGNDMIKYRPTLAHIDARNVPFFVKNSEKKFHEVWSRYSACLSRLPSLKIKFIRGLLNRLADAMTRNTATAIEMSQENHQKTLRQIFPDLVDEAYKWNNAVEWKARLDAGKCVNLACEEDKDQKTNAVCCSQKCFGAATSYGFNRRNFNLPPKTEAKQSVNLMNSAVVFSEVELKPKIIDLPIYKCDYAKVEVLALTINKINHERQYGLKPENCEELKKITDILDNKKDPKNALLKDKFKRHGNRLLHRSTHHSEEDPEWQICVKRDEIHFILAEMHSSPMGAHLGYRATFDAISRMFYWPRMAADVKKWVTNCNICLRVKSKVARMPYVTVPFGTFMRIILFDYVGPLAKSKEGYQYIFTVSIPATKWIEAFPTKEASAKAASKILFQEIFCRFGLPEYVGSDLGDHFVNSVFDHLATRLRITHFKASRGNSRGMGFHERRHLNMNAGILCGLVQRATDLGEKNTTKSNWPDYLPGALFALRTMRSRGDDLSAAELTFGHKPRAPSNLQEFEAKMTSKMKLVVKRNEKFLQAMMIARKISASIDEEKRLYSRLVGGPYTAEDVKLGDPVWLHCKYDFAGYKASTKLDTKWVGPFIVIKQSPKGTPKYQLENADTGDRTNFIHVRFLRKIRLPVLNSQEIQKIMEESKKAKETKQKQTLSQTEGDERKTKRVSKPVYRPFFIKG